MRPPYRINTNRRLGLPVLFLATTMGLVYAPPSLTQPLKAEKTVNEKAEPSNNPVEILRDAKILPAEVDRIRQAILEAAMSGDIEAMRFPIEMNEIPPVFAENKVPDPIAHWRTISGDGEGREILAILVKLFRTGYVRKAPGTGDELYVWPYFAEMPIDELTPSQEVELLTVVPPDRFKAMKASGKYDYYRLTIGHDGTWHAFTDHQD